MAKRLQLKAVKVRHHSTKGKSKFIKIPRGTTRLKPLFAADNVTTASDHSDVESEGPVPMEIYPVTSSEQKPLPTLYSVKQKLASDAWGKARQSLRDAWITSSALPADQVCVHCFDAAAEMICRRCGATAYFCKSCWVSCHEKFNIFHTPEIWENGCFKPAVMLDRRINALNDHSCDSKRDIIITCLDEDGISHALQFVTCDCESLAVTLVKSRLWPATPQNPRYAFCFDLMDWCEALLLECQVSLKSLCEALYYKCPHLVVKRRDVYEMLIDSFEEYRYIKSQLRHLSFFDSEHDKDNVCPACPKEVGTVILSMDALFGLPRKKSAGKSYREPLYDAYFFPQDEVDEFVMHHVQPSVNNVCSSFLAGNPLRSSVRYGALDETAVFGCACRHEVPLLFLNLKHGERLGYAVFTLQNVLTHYPDAINVIMMYDIACTLQRHLKIYGDALPASSNSRLKLAIPAFHAYGHKADCQLTLSPLRCEGIGLSDGEGMERLWSYLRRFSRMTKEMRPSHRIDILSSALSHYGYKKKQNLYTSLLKRKQKAQKVKLEAMENLQKLTVQYKLTDSDIACLVQRSEKREQINTTIPIPSQNWEKDYFYDLFLYYELCDELSATKKGAPKAILEKRISRLLEKLMKTEMDHSILCRWKKDDPLYRDYLMNYFMIQMKDFKNQLHLATEHRQFLLHQKAKYADGQKIAKKLSKQITKITATIKEVLVKYNDLCSHTGTSVLSLQDVLKNDTKIWLLEESAPDIAIPSGAHHEVVQSYFEMKRAEEELSLVEQELKSVCCYYENNLKKIDLAINSIKVKEESAYNRGMIALFTKLKWSFELLQSKSELLPCTEENEEISSEEELSESEYSDVESDVA